MFYLDSDVAARAGHAIYIDSEWALTSISQAQFWAGVDLEQLGDGRVEGILSVDVSEWERPGRRTGKVAAKCTPEEIRDEVWGQLTTTSTTARRPTDDRTCWRWFLDPAIEFPNPTGRDEPRAAAGQHGRLVGRPARGAHAHPQPRPRLGLRAHAHRPGDDGGRQRGRAARRQRDPRPHRLTRAALPASGSCASRRSSPRPRARPACAGSSSAARRRRRCASPTRRARGHRTARRADAAGGRAAHPLTSAVAGPRG